MFIDTHCHINMIIKKQFDVPLPENFESAAQAVIDNAADKDVHYLINVGTSVQESKNCITLARCFKRCFATIATHPSDLNHDWKKDIATYQELLKNQDNKIVGIGETGLDYYHKHDKKQQIAAFHTHITLALEHKLPLVVHTRNANDEVLSILDQYQSNKPKGIIHCFSEDQDFADHAIDLGFVLGIGGPLTYPKNKTLQKVFSQVPLSSIVLETDAPFLPPQQMRGKQNSPAQIKTIAQALAALRDSPLEIIARHTTETASRLFGIKI